MFGKDVGNAWIFVKHGMTSQLGVNSSKSKY